MTIYELCELFGYTKQAFYKRKSKAKTPKYNSELLRSLVVNIRKQLPRTGGKKLHVMLQDEFIKHQKTYIGNVARYKPSEVVVAANAENHPLSQESIIELAEELIKKHF